DAAAGTITIAPALSVAPAAQTGAAVGDEFFISNYAVTAVTATPTTSFTSSALVGASVANRTAVTFYSGTGSNQISYVTGFDGATGTITVAPALATAPAVTSLFALGGNVISAAAPTNGGLTSAGLINIPSP